MLNKRSERRSKSLQLGLLLIDASDERVELPKIARRHSRLVPIERQQFSAFIDRETHCASAGDEGESLNVVIVEIAIAVRASTRDN